MTAFADYIDLQTAVIEMVKRTDLVEVMPRLVKLAEADFNRRLRLADQMELAEVQIDGGTADLPYGFQALVGVYDAAGREYIAQPPQALRAAQSRGYFAVVGRKIHAAADETLTVQFYGSIPTITDGARSSNFLMDQHPGLYLYAVGAEAAKFALDEDMFGKMSAMLKMEYEKAEGSNHSLRFGRARVRVQGATP